MPALLPKVRIAAEMPSPVCLADFEPFKTLTPGQFGISDQEHVGERSLARIRRSCRRDFGTGRSLGFCVLPRPKAVFFDMDATVIKEESLVTLAGLTDKQEEIERITEDAMAGKIDFEQALRHRVKQLAGLKVEAISQIANELTLNEGIQSFVAFCRELGVPTYLVSGGFVRMARVIQRKVGFNDIYANHLADDGTVLTGDLTGDLVDGAGKKLFMEKVCTELGCAPSEVAAVGDGANDLPLLQSVGCPVGFRPKEVLYDHVHAVVGDAGHKFLAPLLFGRDLTMTRQRVSY